MSHKKGKSLIFQVQEALSSMTAFGRSKHRDKVDGNDTHKFIYSFGTYNAYIKALCYFAKYCKEHHGCKTLGQCRQYAEEWLQNGIDRGLSAYTLKQYAAALGKIYQISATDLKIALPKRRRADITRSRGSAVRDKNFSEEKNRELVNFCKVCGLRRKEFTLLRNPPSDGHKLITYKDGEYFIHIERGKGGKSRDALLVGTREEISHVLQKVAVSNDRVFEHIPANMDIHHYRGIYCRRLYEKFARSIEDIPTTERVITYHNRVVKVYNATGKHADISGNGDFYTKVNGKMKLKPGYRDNRTVYCCRFDKKNVWTDRLAMLKVSAFLGHNREGIIAGSYLFADSDSDA